MTHRHHPPDHDDNREILREIERLEEAQLDELREIEHDLHCHPGFPTSLTIKGDSMTRIDPGAIPAFTAVPTPIGSSLGTVIPTWTVAPATDASVVVDATGLVGTVTIAATAVVGDTVTITVTATDGTTTATGTLAVIIGSLPVAFPTSFTITQTA
jgi:hypothetical protein